MRLHSLVRGLLIALSFAVFSSPALRAQNNQGPETAASLVFGHPALTRIGLGASTMWFSVATVAGRSYCAETGHQSGVDGLTDFNNDTLLFVFADDATTVLASNDDALTEPLGGAYSRACWIPSPPTAGLNFVLVKPFDFALPQERHVQLRVVETTLFCAWFFIAGDYNAFSLIRNTTNSALSGIVVTWRGLNGSVAGSTTVSVPANGGLILNARDFVNPGVFSNGTIEIAHKGSPQQLQGSTTTLSGTTGLGFDAPFTQRQNW